MQLPAAWNHCLDSRSLCSSTATAASGADADLLVRLTDPAAGLTELSLDLQPFADPDASSIEDCHWLQISAADVQRSAEVFHCLQQAASASVAM